MGKWNKNLKATRDDFLCVRQGYFMPVDVTGNDPRCGETLPRVKGHPPAPTPMQETVTVSQGPNSGESGSRTCWDLRQSVIDQGSWPP